MTPAGFMAKRICKRPNWIEAPYVVDIFSVSSCISGDFADYIEDWKHNGYWLFNTPEIIRAVAADHSMSLEGTSLFYYEVYKREFTGQTWQPYAPEKGFVTEVVVPLRKQLEGFDVVTFFAKSSAECSPLSCNGLAKDLPVNEHCLFASFEEAEKYLQNGAFNLSEPGPYRIFSVYSVHWPLLTV